MPNHWLTELHDGNGYDVCDLMLYHTRAYIVFLIVQNGKLFGYRRHKFEKTNMAK